MVSLNQDDGAENVGKPKGQEFGGRVQKKELHGQRAPVIYKVHKSSAGTYSSAHGCEERNHSPQLTRGQEQFFFPIARVENLIFHGVLGKIFGIALPQ